MNELPDPPEIPEPYWRDLAFRTELEQYRRAKMLNALGVDLSTYCPANKHPWADTIDLRPVPLTDHLEPYCSACEKGLPGPFGD
jgi:hypothetical protein